MMKGVVIISLPLIHIRILKDYNTKVQYFYMYICILNKYQINVYTIQSYSIIDWIMR